MTQIRRSKAYNWDHIPSDSEPVMTLDFFLSAREDYMHLVKYLDEETR